MSQSLTTERIIRLNNLLKALRDNSYVKSDDILLSVKYSSRRSLENDLKLLRRAFNVKILYSRRFQAYHLEDSGDFMLILKPEKEEKQCLRN